MKGLIDLTSRVGDLLELREPLWIASSHYTAGKERIEAWKRYRPAALTLKTSTRNPAREDKAPIRQKLDRISPRYGRSLYCDGPKHIELHAYEFTADLLKFAQEKLPDTKVGVSVLSSVSEDYETFRNLCATAAFCELNLKYSYRVPKGSGASHLAALPKTFEALLEDVSRFLDAFAGISVFIKLSRELEWLPGSAESSRFLDLLAKHGKAGLIVANSLKQDLSPVIVDGVEKRLEGGVLCGETLFDATRILIQRLSPACKDLQIPIVASGGVLGEEQLLLAIREGAAAVQLCTTFDYYGLGFYGTLKQMLQARVRQQGQRYFKKFRERLPLLPPAALFTLPFTYYERFWLAEPQAQIVADIETSGRMDVFVMSGYSLFQKWKAPMTRRFEHNLGLRLFVPRTDNVSFRAIQTAWGVGDQLEARELRMNSAIDLFTKLWESTRAKRFSGISSESLVEAEFRVLRHSLVPFFSVYVFDQNVYLCPYPVARPTEDVPVYVFFGGGAEYRRLSDELEELVKIVSRVSSDGDERGSLPVDAQTDDGA